MYCAVFTAASAKAVSRTVPYWLATNPPSTSFSPPRDVHALRQPGWAHVAAVALEVFSMLVFQLAYHELPRRRSRRSSISTPSVAKRACSANSSSGRPWRSVDVANSSGPSRSTATGTRDSVVAVEARLVVGARRLAQAAVQAVRPGVVRALQRLAALPCPDATRWARWRQTFDRTRAACRRGRGRRRSGRGRCGWPGSCPARRPARPVRRTARCARARARARAGRSPGRRTTRRAG